MELLSHLHQILTEGTFISIIFKAGRGIQSYWQGQVEEQYFDAAGEMVIEMDQGFVHIDTQAITVVTCLTREEQEYTIEFEGNNRIEIHVLGYA